MSEFPGYECSVVQAWVSRVRQVSRRGSGPTRAARRAGAGGLRSAVGEASTDGERVPVEPAARAGPLFVTSGRRPSPSDRDVSRGQEEPDDDVGIDNDHGRPDSRAASSARRVTGLPLKAARGSRARPIVSAGSTAAPSQRSRRARISRLMLW